MTAAEKPIWIVESKSQSDVSTRENRYAAYDLIELLSFFTEDAKRDIKKIEKLSFKVNYFYK